MAEIRPTDPAPPQKNPSPIAPGTPQVVMTVQGRTTSTSAQKPKDSSAKEPEIKDNTREIVETIVFVVVLVLLLKTFLAEAFVIPTGSMATTLLGYHFDATCQKCEYRFLVNASSEAEGMERRQEAGREGDPNPLGIRSAHCPNCGYRTSIRDGGHR